MTTELSPEEIRLQTVRTSNLWKQYTKLYSGFNSHLDRSLRDGAQIKLDDYQILTVLTDGDPDLDDFPLIRMGELSKALNASPSRLTYQVNRLEQLGWVERVEIPHDRRGKGARITDLGYEIFCKAFTLHIDSLNKTLLSGIPDGDYEVVDRVIKHILEAMEEQLHG
ncbi:MarR family transcriptional regulator [Rothia sp. LK2588]|uniref:MarR family winged helix-turn-helix transcriptional regulator n=1 Tax=Rothia sp. LK2588 TaxID=3114369 RepID=UPI0034CF822D